jgi:hypothetical protein
VNAERRDFKGIKLSWRRFRYDETKHGDGKRPQDTTTAEKPH